MNKHQRNILYSLIGICIIMLLPILAMAQIDGLPTEDVDGVVPLDGGLSLLIAAGVGYGAKKIKEKRNKINSRD